MGPKPRVRVVLLLLAVFLVATTVSSGYEIVSWGANEIGQLGAPPKDVDNGPEPLDVIGNLVGKNITAIFASYQTFYAFTNESEIFAWGANGPLKKIPGTIDWYFAPTRVPDMGILAGKTIARVVGSYPITMALTPNGELYTWGENAYGNIGDGTIVGVNGGVPPAKVVTTGPMNRPIKDMCATDTASFSVDIDGAVFGWGKGALGNGTLSSRSLVPQVVPGLTDIDSLVCGVDHVLALAKNGTLFGWGDNSVGQLAHDPAQFGNFSVPTTIALGNGVLVSKMATGYRSSMVLTTTGKLFTFGNNQRGQLGNSSFTGTSSFIPIPVDQTAIGYDIDEIFGTTGPWMAVLTKTGDVWVWGFIVIDDSLADKVSPTKIDLTAFPFNGEKVKTMAVCSYNGLVLTTSGRPVAWGLYSFIGTGRQAQTFPIAPTDLGELVGKDITSMACGKKFTVAVTNNGSSLYGWGYSAMAQLGTTYHFQNAVYRPTQIASSSDFGGKQIRKVVAGDTFVLVLDEVGLLRGWGYCIKYELGTSERYICGWGIMEIPRTGNLTGLTFVDVEAGSDFVIVLASDGNLYSWGGGGGYLGTGMLESTARPEAYPVNMTELSGKTVYRISAFERHVVVLTTDGSLFSWGQNTYGQLGTGDLIDRLSPTPMSTTFMGRGKIIHIDTGLYHTVALGADGTIYTCGANSNYGVLGYNYVVPIVSKYLQAIFVSIETVDNREVFLENYTAVAAGEQHTIAITTSGYVVAWGRGDYGALGILEETYINWAGPGLVYTGTYSALRNRTAVAVYAGRHSSFALTVAGSPTPVFAPVDPPANPSITVPVAAPTVEPPVNSSPNGVAPVESPAAATQAPASVTVPAAAPVAFESVPVSAPTSTQGSPQQQQTNSPIAGSVDSSPPAEGVLAGGAIAGIIIGVLLALAIAAGVVAFILYRNKQNATDNSVELESKTA